MEKISCASKGIRKNLYIGGLVSKNKKTYEAKRKARETAKKQCGVTKEKGNVKAIASAIMMAIQDEYISYRQFKEIQAIIDKKYYKPEWVPEKKIE